MTSTFVRSAVEVGDYFKRGGSMWSEGWILSARWDSARCLKMLLHREGGGGGGGVGGHTSNGLEDGPPSARWDAARFGAVGREAGGPRFWGGGTGVGKPPPPLVRGPSSACCPRFSLSLRAAAAI